MNEPTENPKAGGRCAQAAGSERCENCGEPAAVYCTVTEGHERMPGWLCKTCIKKHKADVVFPNPKLSGGGPLSNETK